MTAKNTAVVLGASMAGLLAARALSESFERVVVLDRDDLRDTGARKGVPQGQHAHAILNRGREVLEELFPGLTADLSAAGAEVVDLPNDVSWYSGTRQLRKVPSDLMLLSLSRPALEDYIRARVARLPGVELRGGHEVRPRGRRGRGARRPGGGRDRTRQPWYDVADRARLRGAAGGHRPGRSGVLHAGV
jgi:2-polyprenyl-6-methoxyphenol hydroxylase-like FAD-dependent oxidoreductase